MEERTVQHWVGSKNFGKIIVVDLDGVIINFDGWKGPNIFNTVIAGAKKSMLWLKENGWYICIFTTRIVTEELITFLRTNDIVFDDINGRGIAYTEEDPFLKSNYQKYDASHVDYSHIGYKKFWLHNPEFSSVKPIASVYVDDMDWRQRGKNFTWFTWWKLRMSLRFRSFNG